MTDSIIHRATSALRESLQAEPILHVGEEPQGWTLSDEPQHGVAGWSVAGNVIRNQAHFEGLVRAVLRAIREPSEDMLSAAGGVTEGYGSPEDLWKAMIDAALAER